MKVQIYNKNSLNQFLHILYKYSLQSFNNNQPSDTGIWLGAIYNPQFSKFIWEPTGKPIKYTDWATGQPDGNLNADICVTMISGEAGKWNNDQCTRGDQRTMCEMFV